MTAADRSARKRPRAKRRRTIACTATIRARSRRKLCRCLAARQRACIASLILRWPAQRVCLQWCPINRHTWQRWPATGRSHSCFSDRNVNAVLARLEEWHPCEFRSCGWKLDSGFGVPVTSSSPMQWQSQKVDERHKKSEVDGLQTKGKRACMATAADRLATKLPRACAPLTKRWIHIAAAFACANKDFAYGSHRLSD